MSKSRSGMFTEDNLARLSKEASDYQLKTSKAVLFSPNSRFSAEIPKSLIFSRASHQSSKPIALTEHFDPDPSRGVISGNVCSSVFSDTKETSTHHANLEGLAHLSTDLIDHALPGIGKYCLKPKLVIGSAAMTLYDHVSDASHKGVTPSTAFACGVAATLAEQTVSGVSQAALFGAATELTVTSGLTGLPIATGLVTYGLPKIYDASKKVGDVVEGTCQKMFSDSKDKTDQLAIEKINSDVGIHLSTAKLARYIDSRQRGISEEKASHCAGAGSVAEVISSKLFHPGTHDPLLKEEAIQVGDSVQRACERTESDDDYTKSCRAAASEFFMITGRLKWPTGHGSVNYSFNPTDMRTFEKHCKTFEVVPLMKGLSSTLFSPSASIEPGKELISEKTLSNTLSTQDKHTLDDLAKRLDR